MSRIYYRGAKAAVVCFGEHIVHFYNVDSRSIVHLPVVFLLLMHLDLTDQSSFERAKFWVNELKQTEEVK